MFKCTHLQDKFYFRRNTLPIPGMLHPMPLSRHYSVSETRSAAVSPLASPTTSSDSGHPSPDSSQGGKLLLTDSDMRSDGSEISPPSSSNPQGVDGRLASEHLMHGMNSAFMSAHRTDRKRAANFMDSLRAEDKNPSRKRSRSLADASELFLRDGTDPRSLFFRNNLPSIPEIKTENVKKKEECTQASEATERRALNNHDNRLDAAQGLVNLGNMASQFPGLYPFPPELMYPDVMFPRDMFHDLQHLRSPFDIHNPCCFGNDPYTALAMRRWLSNPDMFRSPLNPFLAAQAGLVTPAERMRFLKFPFGYPSPFPGPLPFDLSTTSGLTERNLPEYALRGLYRNGLVPDMTRGGASKESEPQHSPSTEKQSQVRDNNSVSPPSKRASPERSMVKKEGVDDDKGEDTDSAKEEPLEERNRSAKVCSPADNDGDDDEKVDVVGGVKPASELRQTFAGIQEAFNSRLENLNKSFARSLDHNMTCP